ncbi:spinster family MFS transporter [Terricaulis silvestris]|uniref:L-galactonate transporter n=1 Tax=Terricaulis silvestris TaxID=2686094 RepID=A0A6I6MP62_9CAUL|nr:MFS transporter [Terricaulis silvestris]QGZ94714.1 L-galactonate transporter [Terricaulis silvestris]
MTDAPAAAFQGYGTKSYRAYVLGVFVVIYTFNFIDRQLIGIVQEAIREDFGVSNFYLGLLGGPVFAVLYTTLGIPIARLAERANRITIVSIGAFLWSLMTAACGFAGNFVQLAIFRLGVGIGEAACVPPSQSVIADYFPASRRASALAIFSLGIPLGSALAYLGGGWLVSNFDWRTAFWILGAPGIIAALLLKFTVKEPPRSGTQIKPPTFGETLRALSKKASFWHVAFGGALISFVGYGSAQFLVSHLVRNYELGATPALEIAHASYAMGAVAGLSTALGTFFGGYLADRLAPRHPRVNSWLPALGVGIAIPLYVLSFLQTQFIWAFAFLMLAPIFHYLYLGSMYAVSMGVSTPLQRATSIAILILIVNLIGLGLGPPFVGAANDFFASQILSDTSTLTLAQCDPRTVAPENAAACASAQGLGLKYALGATIFFLGWAALHFLLAGRTLVKDRIS